MNIFVCIKSVPDTETRISLSPDSKSLIFSSPKVIINPYDEFAIEEALKLKATTNGIVTVVGVGNKATLTECLRTALAMGCDDAAIIESEFPLDNLATANLLANYLKDKNAGMIFMGKAAIDDNSSAVPQMVGEFLNLPHATMVSKFECANGVSKIERDSEGGSKEIIEVKGACVIAANKGLNTPRYASLPGIMKAKKKTIQELKATDFQLTESKVKFLEYSLPPDRPGCKMMTGDPQAQAAQLARLLREESKVI